MSELCKIIWLGKAISGNATYVTYNRINPRRTRMKPFYRNAEVRRKRDVLLFFKDSTPVDHNEQDFFWDQSNKKGHPAVTFSSPKDTYFKPNS